MPVVPPSPADRPPWRRVRSRRATALAAVAFAVAALGALALYTVVQTHAAEAAFRPGGGFVTAGGVRLHYREAGRGVPVVLLHGNPGFLQDFAPDDSAGVFAALARGYRVIAVDRPGHGYSDRPAADMTPADQVRLLHDVLGRLGAQRPVLVGHSWGGALALLYALAYPRDVRGLVLAGTRAYPTGGNGGALYALARTPVVGALLRHTLMLPIGRGVLDRGLAAAYAPDPVPPEHRAAARALWLRPGQVAATVWDTRNLQRALGAAAAQYGRLAVPVVILVGDHDGGRAESRRLAGAVPGADFVELPRTGHELPRTRPDVIVAAVGRAALGRVALGRESVAEPSK